MMHRILFLSLMWIALAVSQVVGAERRVAYIDPDRATNSSAAVIVPPHLALAHTGLMLPVNREGKVDEGDAAVQADRVLANLNWALAAAGSGREYTVKVNAYVADAESLALVRKRVTEAFHGPVRPAVTFVINDQPQSDILVTMDAVAVAPLREPNKITRFHSHQLPVTHGLSHVTVMPPGEVYYVSGQVAPGEDLAQAVTATMKQLHDTLEHFGLRGSQVVQVKAFIDPMTQADAAMSAIAAMYDQDAMPSVVITQWQAPESMPTEIELIAVRPSETRNDEAVRYLTPPSMTASPVFSRVAVANAAAHHGWVYYSGVHAADAGSVEQQVEQVFAALKRLTDRAGSDFDHLVKATYYISDPEVQTALGKLRPHHYNPQRPPAASLIQVRGTGVAQRSYTLDMIGVRPRP